MKEKIVILLILTSFLIPVLALSQDTFDLPKPGLTPDSSFYFLDTIGKKINLFFTFSPEKKAEKAIQFAEERLAEAKVMGEKNKTKALASANQAYQEFLDLANQKTKEAKEKGKDVEELAILITEKTLKHQEVLMEVFEKVPEEAKTAIQDAIEASRKGSEEAVQSVSGVKKDELLQKAEELRISALEEKVKTLEEKSEERVVAAEAEAERLKREMEAAKGEAEKARLMAEVEMAKAETERLKRELEINQKLTIEPNKDTSQIQTEPKPEITPVKLSIIAQDTPAAAQVGLNTFTKIKFIGGSTDTTITKIMVTRGGVSSDTYVSYIELYDGSTKLDAIQALNRNTHKATFSGFSWKIPAGETKILDIKASITPLRTATVGESIILGINSVSDITSSAPLSGDFPLMGDAKIINADILIGTLDVNVQNTPAANTIISGSTNQEIASWKFTANSVEDLNVKQIRITHTGSIQRDYIKNIRLEIDGVQIGGMVAALDTMNVATFDLSDSPLLIHANNSKVIHAYADIASGEWTRRTVTFEITQYPDVAAYGFNSKELATVTANNWSAYTRQIGSTMIINQGTLTVDIDTNLNPSSQVYEAMSLDNNLLAAFKFTAGQEGIRVARLGLRVDPDVSSFDITLWDGLGQIPVTNYSFLFGGSGCVIGFSPGLFDIPAFSTKTIQIKAANVQNGFLGVNINASADICADGLKSKYDIPTENITIIPGRGNVHAFE